MALYHDSGLLHFPFFGEKNVLFLGKSFRLFGSVLKHPVSVKGNKNGVEKYEEEE
jgi:hypothetical protein